MSGFVPPVHRKKAGRGHYYVDGNGQRIPGVTSVLNDGVPKKLVDWAAKTVAAYAVNRWDELSEKPVAVRLKELEGAHWADRDQAAHRGTEVHRIAERLVHGEKVPVPDELAGHVDSYVRFLDDWQPDPILTESVVVNYQHGYAGTIDGLFAMPNLGSVLIDIKTGRSGIFGDVALQLAAYRYAEFYLTDGGEQPMPPVDSCAAIHVRADGYALVPIEAGRAQFRTFLYGMQVGAFLATSRDLIGEELIPPQSGLAVVS